MRATPANLETIQSNVTRVTLPLQLIKSNPQLLTQLLSPNDGYMKLAQHIYQRKQKPSCNFAIPSPAHDPLTLMLELENTLIQSFHWMHNLRIGQELTYDEQPALVTDIQYTICTQSPTPSPPNNAETTLERYLARITEPRQRIPRCGSHIRGSIVREVSVCQITLQICQHSSFPVPPFSHRSHSRAHTTNQSFSSTLDTMERAHTIDTSESAMFTPEPATSVIINVQEDPDKVSKIGVEAILESFADEVVTSGDIHLAIRPNTHQFLYLCSQIFERIYLVTNAGMNATLLEALHAHLVAKLRQSDGANVGSHDEHHSFRLWHEVCVLDRGQRMADTVMNHSFMDLRRLSDVSRVVMLDSGLTTCFEGFEPNRMIANGYVPNNFDHELMDKVWPLLLECHKFVDVRYALLGKTKDALGAGAGSVGDKVVVTESQSLAQTMQYLVTLQYSYFKSCELFGSCDLGKKRLKGVSEMRGKRARAGGEGVFVIVDGSDVDSDESESDVDSSSSGTEEYSERTDTESDDMESERDAKTDSWGGKRSEGNESTSKHVETLPPEMFGCASVLSDFTSFFARCISK